MKKGVVMKKIFLSAIILFGLQNLVFAIDIPSWNDFAPSVIKPEYQEYWDARYREFESDLNYCKGLPAAQRPACYNQLSVNERDKNNKFYANPSTITSKPSSNTIRTSSFSLSLGVPIGYSYRYWDYPEYFIFPPVHHVHYHRVPPPPPHIGHRPPMPHHAGPNHIAPHHSVPHRSGPHHHH